MKHRITILLFFSTFSAFSQMNLKVDEQNDVVHKYRVSTVFLMTDLFLVDWNKRTSIQMIEFHAKRNLDNKNIIGVKFATWRLFQPMGIKWWDGLLDKIESESEFYPGHVRETGIGITYQRMLWKGLFATAEILPQFQTYMNLEGDKIGNGFKLYNSYHLGYHIAFGKKKRFFIEPQVHCQHWMFDNNAPAGFRELDAKWGKYFLFEPNLYFGVKF